MREGLEAIDTVAAVSPRPDAVRGTFEMRAKDPGLVNPQLLATNIFLMGVGARLRGLELTADGTLEKHNSQFLLRIDGVKVPCGSPRSAKNPDEQPQKAPRRNLRARAHRLPNSRRASLQRRPRVRITGPLAKPTATAEAVLEVRTFEFVTARP